MNSTDTATARGGGGKLRPLGKGLLGLPTRQFLLSFTGITILSLLAFFLLVPQVFPIFYSNGQMFGVSAAMVVGLLGMLATSWSSRQPTSMFFGLVLGVMTFRIMVMAGAFAVGFLTYKFEIFSLVAGLFVTYFVFLFVEIVVFLTKMRHKPSAKG